MSGPGGASAPPTAAADSDTSVRAHAVVTSVWAVAVLVHLLGNPAVAFGEALPAPGGAVVPVVALLAGLVALRPTRRPLAVALVVAVWVLAGVRLPVLANNLVLLAVVGTALVSARDPGVAVRNVVRVGAAAYAFAAFAKWNTSFLDPAVSCAPVILDRLVGSWGVAPLPRGLTDLSPVLALTVESAVGIGLLVPRLRRWVALLGVGFHGLLAYDLDQHFWDFTAALLPVFAAAAPAVALRLADGARRVLTARVAVAGVATLVLVGTVTALPSAAVAAVGFLVGHALWWTLGTATVLGWFLVELRSRPAPVPLPTGWSVGGVALAALVVLNGLTPYTQVKTGYGWNMYSNLRVVDDATNHLLVPPMSLRGDLELVAVVDASDEDVAAYADRGVAIPLVQVLDWVRRTPGGSVTVRAEGGEPVTLVHGEVATRSRWLALVAPLRPVDEPCLLSYGPLG